jgi:hypothetical protein
MARLRRSDLTGPGVNRTARQLGLEAAVIDLLGDAEAVAA